MSRNFYVRSCVKFTIANKIEAMHERSLVSVKVEPRSTSRLRSGLFTLPLFYLRDYNLRALTCVAKKASVEINLSRNFYVRSCVKFMFVNKIEAMHERSLVSVKVEPQKIRLEVFIFPPTVFHNNYNK